MADSVSAPRQGSAWGDGQGRAPPTQRRPPTPRLARNFFITAPSPYAAYFFLALNPLVLLLIRFWGG